MPHGHFLPTELLDVPPAVTLRVVEIPSSVCLDVLLMGALSSLWIIRHVCLSRHSKVLFREIGVPSRRVVRALDAATRELSKTLKHSRKEAFLEGRVK